MKWKSTPLGEVMRHRKGSITIDDTTTYKLCRVQVHRRGVVLRQELAGTGISTKKQQVCKSGDFLVAEMDAKVGGYGFVPPELDGAIVSSHYYLFEVDAEKLHPEYLEVVSQAEILQQQIVAKGSTNYSSIRPGSVLEWQIPLPLDIDVQKQIARNFWAIQSKLSAARTEITHQQSLLAKLKQAILQEAIQGKLTADWRAAHPDVEPASQLLHRIQAEKARLIAAKKLRPEKPLPKITPAEIPFEIPKGWAWCCLGSLGYTQTGTTPDTTVPENFGNFIPFVKPADIDDDGITYEAKGLSERGLHEGRLIEPDSIMMVCIGSSTGKVAVNDRPVSCNQQINAITFLDEVHERCVEFILKSPYFQTALWAATKTGITPIINKSKWAGIVIPLPPLAEQAAIVERVEALMTTCRALEAEIEHARTHAAHLLQAVLKEAFAPASARKPAPSKRGRALILDI
jgi:restriction endonuclease S subunit